METKPVFSLTTAHRRLLGFNRTGNNIHALVAYMIGHTVPINHCNNILSTCVGRETYKFENAQFADMGYNLFDKVYQYELFLASQTKDNARLIQYADSMLKAFNAQYDGKQRPFYQRWCNSLHLNLNSCEMEPLFMHAYDPASLYMITSGEGVKQPAVCINGCRPIFDYAVKQDFNDAIYVYEFSLAKHLNIVNAYVARPCVNISLFNDENAVHEYIKQTKQDQEKFASRKRFQDLYIDSWFALQRFEKYVKMNSLTK